MLLARNKRMRLYTNVPLRFSLPTSALPDGDERQVDMRIASAYREVRLLSYRWSEAKVLLRS